MSYLKCVFAEAERLSRAMLCQMQFISMRVRMGGLVGCQVAKMEVKWSSNPSWISKLA